MKKVIIALFMMTATATASAQQTADRWVPGQKLAALAAAYETFCEDMLGGEYGYDQGPDGPSSWYCKGGSWKRIFAK